MLLEARHTEFDQHVVIRLMSPSLCDEKELERFRREARTLSKLESEHCARIIDVGTHSDGSFFLVRQYLEGTDLATQLRNQGGLRLDQAVNFILQASEVVQECHSHNIVLRELQPSHLFIAQKRGGAGSLKVIDFGTAKLLKGPSASEDPDNQATAIFGISNYWSPEMVRKGAVDPRTDVWSLGCIFYEMLAAVPAFSGEMAELMLKISRDDPMPITRLRPDLPRELDQIVSWALAKDPNSRFGSVYAFAHALRPYASPEGQVLIDQIGRIAHSAPAATSEVAVSPTSPLAAGQSSLLDDEEGSSTVIMQSPMDDSESDLEKTSFMHDSPFASMAPAGPSRGSIPAPRGSGAGIQPGLTEVQGGGPFGGSIAPPNPSGPGGYPSQTATGQHIQAQQRSTAKWVLVAAAIVVPVLAILVLVLRKPPAETKSAQNTPTATGVATDPVPTPGKSSDPVSTGGAADPTPTESTTSGGAPPSGSSGGSKVTPPPPGPDRARPGGTSSPTVTPAASSAPPPPPPPPPTTSSGGGGDTGSIIGIATGGTCAWSVDGRPQGNGQTFKATVTVGSHKVTCTPAGQAARSQTKSVTADRPAVANFKL